jgi:O-phosphoseryl-tRNA(Sec) kinase
MKTSEEELVMGVGGSSWDSAAGESRNVNNNVSLVVLMGLPASGKTHLAHKIELELCKDNETIIDGSLVMTILISYDDFVPHEAQTRLPSCSAAESSAAKVLRKCYVECVDFIVLELMTGRGFRVNLDKRLEDWGDNKLQLSPGVEELVSRKVFVSKVREILGSVKDATARDFIVIVDDNNYYVSMRNELYQIAKTRRTGFCILFCKTSVKTCRRRNSERDEKFRVPDKTIVEMSLKLEEPSAMTNPCDTYCVQITEQEELTTEVEQDNIPLVIQVIRSSLRNPVEWKPPPDRTEEIERERRICSENEVHQADLILRKWVNKELGLLSLAMSKSGGNLAKLNSDYRRRKALTLEKLRSGEIRVLNDVSQEIEFQSEVVRIARNIKLD